MGREDQRPAILIHNLLCHGQTWARATNWCDTGYSSKVKFKNKMYRKKENYNEPICRDANWQVMMMKETRHVEVMPSAFRYSRSGNQPIPASVLYKNTWLLCYHINIQAEMLLLFFWTSSQKVQVQGSDEKKEKVKKGISKDMGIFSLVTNEGVDKKLLNFDWDLKQYYGKYWRWRTEGVNCTTWWN